MNGEEARMLEWLQYAEEDLQVATITLREEGPPNQVCFHAQQVAEKYLKGFLTYYNQKFAKQHQLPYLLERAEKIEPSLNEIEEDIFMLNRFYLETRYPGNIPNFSETEAREALAAAERVAQFIKGKLNI